MFKREKAFKICMYISFLSSPPFPRVLGVKRRKEEWKEKGRDLAAGKEKEERKVVKGYLCFSSSTPE